MDDNNLGKIPFEAGENHNNSTLPKSHSEGSFPEPAVTRSQPTIPRISHHLLLCCTPTKALCCPDPAIGQASWNTLKRLVRELGLEDRLRPQGMVLRTKVDCLRVCAKGPILLIWPDGCVYGAVDAERIETIIHNHIIGSQPIAGWIIQHYERI